MYTEAEKIQRGLPFLIRNYALDGNFVYKERIDSNPCANSRPEWRKMKMQIPIPNAMLAMTSPLSDAV